MAPTRNVLLLVALAALLAGCAAAPTRLEYGRYDSEAMRVSMGYAVYTPPGFREDERLPLVVFLHGAGDDPRAFDRHQVAATLDEAVTAGRMPRVVVALPQGDLGFWANWRDGTRNYRDWVVWELLPHVRRAYHTAPCPEGCHVMGVSMGGAGAVGMALHHQDLFASATFVSAPILDTRQMLDLRDDRLFQLIAPTHRIWGDDTPATAVREDDVFLRWGAPADVGLRLYVAWATRDAARIRSSSQRLHEHLASHHIEHAHEEFDGDHAWRSWAPVIVRAIAYGVGGAAEEDSSAASASSAGTRRPSASRTVRRARVAAKRSS